MNDEISHSLIPFFSVYLNEYNECINEWVNFYIFRATDTQKQFYIRGSVHRESNLIIVQQDATSSLYYVTVGSYTCFGCWHPSSGARTNVNTASGIN